jgi:hypothetical protein
LDFYDDQTHVHPSINPDGCAAKRPFTIPPIKNMPCANGNPETETRKDSIRRLFVLSQNLNTQNAKLVL